MKTRKLPYTDPCSLLLIPVGKITSFAIIYSKVFIEYEPGSYEQDFIPGSFVPDAQTENPEGNVTYPINHTFSVSFPCLENEQKLNLLSKQEFVAIYTNEARQRVVSGTPENPLSFSYFLGSGNYSCQLSGITKELEAYVSPL